MTTPLVPARPALISLHARISENTLRDLRGVETLTRLGTTRFGVTPRAIVGRQEPFGRTPWQDDLRASREHLSLAAAYLDEALAGTTPVLTLATDCALAIATLPVVARRQPDARVLWLDAHCDFDTPETTTIGFLGCMSLAGACGLWDTRFAPALSAQRVVLCGTRPAAADFDIAAQRQVEQSAVTLVGITETTADDVLAALGDAPVYVHLDPDVLDPSVNPVPYARPHGLSAQSLRDLLAALAARNRVVGVEITAFHSPDDAAERSALAELLLGAVTPLLAPMAGTSHDSHASP